MILEMRINLTQGNYPNGPRYLFSFISLPFYIIAVKTKWKKRNKN